MRFVIVAALSLILGLVLGGLGPKAELREARALLAEQEARECPPAVGGELARLFSAGRSNAAAPPPSKPDRPRPPTPGDAPEARAPRADAPAPEGAEGAEQLDALRSALRLRRSQARAALVEAAAPDAAQLDALDAAVQDMNDDLFTLADELSARLAAGEPPPRRDLMAFAADTLDVMISAEDRIADTLTEAQRANTPDESLDPFSYVDPGLIDLLEGLDKP